jgi:hypothetical protein
MTLNAAPALRDIPPGPIVSIADGLRVLYACRVSALAVALGFVLLVGVNQARDLFLTFGGPAIVGGETANGNLFASFMRWACYFLLHIFLWAMMVQSSAQYLLRDSAWLIGPKRELTDRDRAIYDRRFRIWVVLMPYLLAALTYLAVWMGYDAALRDLPDTGDGTLAQSARIVQEERLGFYLALAGAFVAHFVLWLRNVREIARENAGFVPMRPQFLAATLGDDDPDRQHAIVMQASVYLVIGFVALVLTALFGEQVLQVANGIYLVPVLLGAWIPLFSKLGEWSQRSHVPFTLFFALAWVALVAWYGHPNDVRRAGIEPLPAQNLAAAAEAWKQANCIGKNCPRPILVTTAGGASRAAFFTATVLGELLDNPCLEPGRDCEGPSPATPLLARRIFAISGVSGGSLGAAQTVAAMADARAGAAPPCTGAQPDHFFRRPVAGSWRDCLQILASDDFLSHTALAMATGEPLLFFERWLGWLWAGKPFRDRAAILEDRWIASYRSHAGAPPTPAGARSAGDLAGSFTRLGAERRRDGGWLPLLVLNGTAEETGRRVLSSQIDAKLGSEPLFVDAYDVNALLGRLPEPGRTQNDDARCARLRPGEGRDLTVASAVSNSARFPVVSPSGRFSRDCAVILSIVDGGYFENDGATTTAEIARGLKAAGLRPAVIHIANEPRDQTDEPNADLLPDRIPDSLLPVLQGPLRALLATRSARGSYALAALQSEVGVENLTAFLVYGETARAGVESFSQVEGLSGYRSTTQRPGTYSCFAKTVKDDAGSDTLKKVSMSWWLSKPVQEYLDRQTYFEPNCRSFLKARGWIGELLPPVR